MRVGLRIRNISIKHISPTLITAEDNNRIFQYSGELTAVLDSNGDQNADIWWEQTSGVPVTFTSSLTGLTVTFTTTDLNTKTFRVYTNKGTLYERYADVTFFHYPVSNMEHVNSNTNNSITWSSHPTKKSYFNTISGQIVVNKSSITGFIEDIHNAVNLTNVNDEFTEYVIGFNSDIVKQVKEIRGYNLVGNTWTLFLTHQGYLEHINGNNFNGQVRFEVDVEYPGFSGTLIVEAKSGLESKGASNLMDYKSSSTNNALSNYTSNLQTIKILPPYINDMDYNTSITSNSISGYSSNLQVLKALPPFIANMDYKPNSTSNSFSNYTYSLQTSTGIT